MEHIRNALRGTVRSTLGTLLVLGLITLAFVGGTAAAAEAEKPTIVVGGKNFTEQYILAHLLAELIEQEGFPTEVRAGLAAGDVIFQAMRRGDIHMYVEYSGTAWTGFLNESLVEGMDPDELYEKTAAGMRERFDMEMLPTLGFSNSYVFATTKEIAEQYNLSKVSDLIPVANRLTLGGTLAFMGDRPDGIRGAEKTYGFKFRRNRALDHALLFQALQLKQVDVIVPFSTDGQNAALDLVLLEDDRRAFPPYHAGVIAPVELFEQYPELREALGRLEGLLDESTMAQLNYQVDGHRRDEREVAREFLREQGLLR